MLGTEPISALYSWRIERVAIRVVQWGWGIVSMCILRNRIFFMMGLCLFSLPCLPVNSLNWC